MSKQRLHWKNLILLLQMLQSGFQGEGKDVFNLFQKADILCDDLKTAAHNYNTIV